MWKPDDAQDDPIDAALGCDIAQPAAADALRTAVFARTVGVMRRRRRMKRCSLAAGLLGCYLAGIVTMGLCWPGNRNVAVAENPLGATAGLSSSARNTGGQAIRGTQTNQQPQNAQPAAVPVPSGSAGQLVAARIPTAFESWRNIGDYYLQKTGDISLAVASYSEAINLATESERALSPERDTWLLMALKDSRGKDSRAMDSLEKEQNYVIPEPN